MGNKPEVPAEVLPPVVRTSAGLRDVLFDELDRMRNGRTNATNANAISRLAGEIANTIQMELEVHRELSRIPGDHPAGEQPRLPQSIELGARRNASSH